MTKNELFEKCCGVIQSADPQLYKSPCLIMRPVVNKDDCTKLDELPMIVSRAAITPKDKLLLELSRHDLTIGLTSKKWGRLTEVCEEVAIAT